jgi:hypothetical protein
VATALTPAADDAYRVVASRADAGDPVDRSAPIEATSAKSAV